MFDKLVKKFSKGAMANVKATVKEEISQSADDILPTIVGIASIALLIFASIPAKKPVQPSITNITINNYFIGR